MLKKLGGRFSPSMMVAVAALVFATSGSAIAAKTLIDGSTIEKNSIPANRLTKGAEKSLQGEKGDTGQRGQKGARGTTGAVGPVGPIGPKGAAGLQGPAGKDGVDGTDGTDGTDGVVALYTDGSTFKEGNSGRLTPVQANLADYTGGAEMRSIELTTPGSYLLDSALSVRGPQSGTASTEAPISQTRCNLVANEDEEIDTFYVDFWRPDVPYPNPGYRQAINIGGTVEVEVGAPKTITVNCYAAITANADDGGYIGAAKLTAMPVSAVIDAHTPTP